MAKGTGRALARGRTGFFGQRKTKRDNNRSSRKGSRY